MTTPLLSPAAQAVLDAYHRELPPDGHPGGISAAIRALVEQTLPEELEPAPLPPIHEMIENPMESIGHEVAILQRQQTRAKQLAIAAELAGTTTTKKQ
jgi:hypothetical protein